jgi:hypothetical protein
MGLALDLVRAGAVRVHAFCYPGVVHGCVRSDADLAALLAPFRSALFAVGGDWHTRHRLLPEAQPAETRWMEILEPVLRGV